MLVLVQVNDRLETLNDYYATQNSKKTIKQPNVITLDAIPVITLRRELVLTSTAVLLQ